MNEKEEPRMANSNVLAQIDEQVKKNKIIIYMKGTPSFPMWLLGGDGRGVGFL